MPRPEQGSLVLRARWVLPIDAPPIENGEVRVESGRIVSVGPANRAPAAPRDEVRDFGLAAILPGLINVHTHLEYTLFRGLLEDLPFFPWIRTLTRLKAHLTPDDWRASSVLGVAEMLAAGVTCVGDCADADSTLPALLESGLRGIVFKEIFGITDSEPIAATVAGLAGAVAAMRAQVADAGAGDRIGIGISPHAPYTVRAPLFAALADLARREKLWQAIHVAESPAEVALIEGGTGAIAEMFAQRAIPWTAPGVSPTRYVAGCGGFGAPTLAIHCVHVSRDDAALLAAHGTAVAHCPKSNGKLGVGVAPLPLLLAAGIPVGLGTDSVASNNGVDLFEEMRFALYNARACTRDAAALTASDALRMATLGGARCLGRDATIGSLTPGKRADLCVARLDGLHTFPAASDNPIAALVYGARASDIVSTIVDGRILYENGRFATIALPKTRRLAEGARRRLREAVDAT